MQNVKQNCGFWQKPFSSFSFQMKFGMGFMNQAMNFKQHVRLNKMSDLATFQATNSREWRKL